MEEDKHTLSPQNVPEISFHSIPSTPSPTCSESKSGHDPFFLNVNTSSIPQHIVNRRHTLGPLSFGEDLNSSEEKTFNPHDSAPFANVPHLVTGHSSQENTYYALPDFTGKDKCSQLSSHSSSCTPSSSPQPYPYLCYAQVKERRVSDTGYLKGMKSRLNEGQNANTLKRSHAEYTNLYNMEKSKFPKQSSKQHKGILSKLVNASQHKFSRNSATYPVQEDPDEQSILGSSEVSTPISDPPGEMTPTSGNLSANSLLCQSPEPPTLTTSMPPNIFRRRNSRPRSITSNYENYSLPPNMTCSSVSQTSQVHEQLQERLNDIHINQIPIHKSLTPQCTASESACILSLPTNSSHRIPHTINDYTRTNSDDSQLSTSANTTSAILSKCNNNNNQYQFLQTHALSGAKLGHGILQPNSVFVQRTLIHLHNSLSLNNADFPSGTPTNSSLLPQTFYLNPDLSTAVLRQPLATPALDETLQIPHMTVVNTQNRQFFT